MTRVCTSQLWNVDRDCARGLTWVVCSGIMIGNYIKDVFLYAAWVVPPTPGWCVIRILTYDVGRVPRPPSPPVWVPHKTASTDSTALRDYGFPSTHSVNGVTNPTYFIMCVQCLAGACRGHCVVMRLACVCCRYLWRAGYISVNNPYWMAVILVCGLVWLGSLSFGRMYLGVHSPSDVEGGVVRPCFVSREPGGVSAGANLVLLSRLLAPASCLSHTCTAQKSTPGSLRMSMPFRCCSLGW